MQRKEELTEDICIADITEEAPDEKAVEEKPKRGRKKAQEADAEPPAASESPEPEDLTDALLPESGVPSPQAFCEESTESESPEPSAAGLLPAVQAPPETGKSFYDLNFNELDRGLSAEQRDEWNAIYASYRSRSVLSGSVIGVDQHTFHMYDSETGNKELKTMSSVIVINYRVKILIPEAEMWAENESRPEYVLRNTAGAAINYVIMNIDREGECAVASRRAALAPKRRYFKTARAGHHEGELLECRVLAVGPKRCLVECNGYDISLLPRDLSYSAIPDLREKYHPGQSLACKLTSYDPEADRLEISVKEVNPNPFIGADLRHPVGCRRMATISGKYAGGVFCTLADETVCLCLYSSLHSDNVFRAGDSVIIAIRQYDYVRKLIYGRILAKR